MSIADTIRASLQRLCERAALHAAIKADDRMRAGDIHGERMWKRVLAATLRIRLSLPANGKT